MRLFTERATAVRPTFAITHETTPVVARICRSLDGIPLAIELAAARRRMLSLEQIAAGLADRFHLLTGGARTALPRQQTLRASVEWSYDLLTPSERMLLRRLAVFRGGFTLEAVEGVCAFEDLSQPEILDLLASLIDNSLVVVEERGASVRYGLLEMVREFASERLLESGGTAPTRARHGEFFLALAETTASEPAKGGQAAWLEALDPEASNLDAALDCFVETDGERALRLCTALHHWWRLRGLFTAADRSFRRALEAADPAPSASRARVLYSHAHLLVNTGDYVGAIDTAQRSLAMAEEVGDDVALAGALAILGTIQVFPDPRRLPPAARALTGARSAQRGRLVRVRRDADPHLVVPALRRLRGGRSPARGGAAADRADRLPRLRDLLVLVRQELRRAHAGRHRPLPRPGHAGRGGRRGGR